MHKSYPKYLPSILLHCSPENQKRELLKYLDILNKVKKKKELEYFFYFTKPNIIQFIIKFPSSETESKLLQYLKQNAENTSIVDKTSLFSKIEYGYEFTMYQRHLNETGGLNTVTNSEELLSVFSLIYLENQKNSIEELNQWLPYLYYLYVSLSKKFQLGTFDLGKLFEDLLEEVRPKEWQYEFKNELEAAEFLQRNSELEEAISQINIDNKNLLMETLNAIKENIDTIDIDTEWQKKWKTSLNKNATPWYKAIKTSEITLPSYFVPMGNTNSDQTNPISLLFIKYIIRAWSNQMFADTNQELFLYDFYSRVFNNK